MKKSELRQIIKEEISKVLKEDTQYPKSPYYLVTNSFLLGPKYASWAIRLTKGDLLKWSSSDIELSRYTSNTDEWRIVAPPISGETQLDFPKYGREGREMLQDFLKNTKPLNQKQSQDMMKNLKGRR